MTILSRVGADGILNVSVPVGKADAHRPVQVIIEPADIGLDTGGDYGAWLNGLSGRWQGDFVRDDEGTFESRESLS